MPKPGIKILSHTVGTGTENRGGSGRGLAVDDSGGQTNLKTPEQMLPMIKKACLIMLKSWIEEITPRPNVFVHVRCGPAGGMRTLMAPRIEARHIAALAD